MTSLIQKLTKRLTKSNNSIDKEESKESNFKSPKIKNEQQYKKLAYSKVNVNQIYNCQAEYIPIQQINGKVEVRISEEDKLYKSFQEIIDSPIVNYDSLKQLSWKGIPANLRGNAWRILLKYMPTNKESQEITLQKKRAEYKSFTKLYCENLNEDQLEENERKILKIIYSDVPRTQPECPIFHLEAIQNMLIRILFIWNMRHPASGYVQGINDLTTPFIAVFMNNYISINFDTFANPPDINEFLTQDIIDEIEADTYWCLSKVLDGVLDNYTQSHPGVLKSLSKINEIIKKMHLNLYNHFEKQELNFSQFGFRWVYCLLIREFPLKLGLRLFDTYISDDEGFQVLHVYVCSALLMKWSNKLQKMQFNDLMLFLQNLPTKEWGEEDINMLLAESYVFKSIFEPSSRLNTK